MNTSKPSLLEQASQWVKQKVHEHRYNKLFATDEYETFPAWRVRMEYETVTFADEQFAMQWAKTHQGVVETTSSTHPYSSATLAAWIEMQKNGFSVPNFSSCILEARPQSMDAILSWFQTKRDANSLNALHLLMFAFSINRPDATRYVARWALEKSEHWCVQKEMEPNHTDLFATVPGNEHKIPLFQRMLGHPSLMEWLFEHQPQLKDNLCEPSMWKHTQDVLEKADASIQCNWPCIAYRIFEVNIPPLAFSKFNQVQYRHCVLPMYKNFSHDPAAQCYLLHALPQEALVLNFPKHTGNPHVQIFGRKLCAMIEHKDPTAIPTTLVVDNLMLGIHLGQTPEELYEHARAVFATELGTKYTALDNTIDGELFIQNT